MVFSEAQMQQFSQQDIEDFAQQEQADLWTQRETLEHMQTLAPVELRRHIDLHIAKASSYGLETEDGVRAYLRCVAGRLGWSFEENIGHSQASDILKNTALAEEEKLKQLQAYCDPTTNTRA